MQHHKIRSTALVAALVSAALVAAPLGSAAATTAPRTARTSTATESSAPVGNVGKFTQTQVENFRTTASANGQFARTYRNSWQPYPDGTGGMYYSSAQISAHDGYMDVSLDGRHGSAGTFGTPAGAWTHVGGKFTVRAKATGGDGNGAAFMLWPTSNVWSDGEIDYPEANFESAPMGHQHSMTPGREATSVDVSTGVSWRRWHTYSVEWIPGKSVTYLVDSKVLSRVTKDVPTTAHRYMFQVGNWGLAGHLDIDWFSTYDYTG